MKKTYLFYVNYLLFLFSTFSDRSYTIKAAFILRTILFKVIASKSNDFALLNENIVLYFPLSFSFTYEITC